MLIAIFVILAVVVVGDWLVQHFDNDRHYQQFWAARGVHLPRPPRWPRR
jgi:hypothetical protein